MKTKKITLYGGFHNSAPINIIISAEDAEEVRKGICPITDVLTPSQRRKLDRHFCGISDCKCGGVTRATIDFND